MDTRELIRISSAAVHLSGSNGTNEIARGTFQLLLSDQIVEDEHGALLAMIVNGEWEYTLEPEDTIIPLSDNRYEIPLRSSADHKLIIDFGKGISLEDKETLEVLWSEYIAYQDTETQFKEQLVLIDDHGSVVGELEGYDVKEDPELTKPGHEKDPVIIDIENKTVKLQQSTYITRAADYVSSGILFGSTQIGKGMNAAAAAYTKKYKATETPLVFKDTTKANVKRIHTLSNQAVSMSGKTLGMVSKGIERVGTSIGHSLPGGGSSSKKKDAKPSKPGFIRSGIIAFVTIADAVEQGGKSLLQNGVQASSTVVGHRYGDEAKQMTAQFGGVLTNVGLVYIDVRGVSRKALLKTAGKSALKCKLSNGDEVILRNEGAPPTPSSSSPPIYSSPISSPALPPRKQFLE